MNLRPIRRLSQSRPTREGAGVHLHRAIGFPGADPAVDPFLLLDDFRSDVPSDYLAGFPWHPHRGMETITYVLAGTVEHGDSLGHRGIIGAGDVQWMTAGSGIIHQEMPKGNAAGQMYGFQLWANLPAALKMTPPRYQEVKAADIPVVADEDCEVRVVCGSFRGIRGRVDGVAADPLYLDVSIAPGRRVTLPVPADHHVFAYVFSGQGKFCNVAKPLSVPTQSTQWLDINPPADEGDRTLVVFGDGDAIEVEAGDEGMRFLLVAGRPLREPVAWYGPIVMNTQEELREAFNQLDRGTFLAPHQVD
ncbi:MAG TPA: pirin family protein [Rhodanobacteraceae bacterium]|nr:pirin family protein [Rhodanobacteraceae bacterium]